MNPLLPQVVSMIPVWPRSKCLTSHKFIRVKSKGSKICNSKYNPLRTIGKRNTEQVLPPAKINSWIVFRMMSICSISAWKSRRSRKRFWGSRFMRSGWSRFLRNSKNMQRMSNIRCKSSIRYLRGKHAGSRITWTSLATSMMRFKELIRLITLPIRTTYMMWWWRRMLRRPAIPTFFWDLQGQQVNRPTDPILLQDRLMFREWDLVSSPCLLAATITTKKISMLHLRCIRACRIKHSILSAS